MPGVFLIHGWEGNPNNHWFPWLSWELKARGWEVNAPQMPNAAKPKVKEWVDFLRDYVGKPDKDTYFVGHSLGCIAIARYLAKLPGNTNYETDTRPTERLQSFGRAKVRNTPSAFGISPSKEGERRRREATKVGGCVFVAGFSGFARERSERLQNLNPAPTPGQARARIAPPSLGEARVRMPSGAGVGRPYYTIPEIAEFYSLSFDAEKAKKHCDKFVVIFSDNDPYVPMEKSLEFAKQLGAKTILERGKGHFSDGLTALPSALQALLKMNGL